MSKADFVRQYKKTVNHPRWRAVIIFLACVAVVWFGFLLLRSMRQNTPRGSATQEPRVAYWSCSMHPHIKLPAPGRCPLCAMDLIPVSGDVSGAEGLSEASLTLSKTARNLAEVETAEVRYEVVFSEIRLVGKLEHDETRLVHIAARVPGRLERLYVDFTGTKVRKGDPLITIYSPELISAQEEYIQALKHWEQVGDNSLYLTRHSAERMVKSAAEKLRLVGMSEEGIKSVAESRRWLEHVTLNSPVSGTVISKNGIAGMYIGTGDTIYTVADLSQLWLFLEAYESDIQWVRLGQAVSVEIEAYPGEAFQGTISFVNPFVSEITRTIGLRVDVVNEDERLKPGMFARASVKTPFSVTGEKALVIPASAPLITGKRAVVYVEKPYTDDTHLYEGREVVLGPRAQDQYVVFSGLREGERVVTKGNFKIDSAMQIMAKPSMMNPSGYYTEGENEGVLSKRPMPFLENAGILAESIRYYLEAVKFLAHDNAQSAAAQLEQFRRELSALLREYKPARGEGLLPEIRRLLQETAKADDTLGGLRSALREVSLILRAVLAEHEYTETTVLYVAFCPMAFDSEGAYWIQDTEPIANPYFGAAMFTCGEIKERYGRQKAARPTAPPPAHHH